MQGSKSNQLIKNIALAVIVIAVGLGIGVLVNGNPFSTDPAPVAKAPSKRNLAYLKDDDPSLVANMWPPKQFPNVPASARTSVTAKPPVEPRWPIIDVHEHVETEKDLKLLLEGMDRYGIQRTCILAATKYTFTLDRKYGFEQFKENNEALLKMKEKYPDRVCAFVTIDPRDEGNLELLKDYVARGADGLKLYLGHGESTGKGPFHVMPLDDPRMLPLYKYAQDIQLPVLMHINLIKYMDETISVLEKNPYLRLCIPHFGLHKNTMSRLNRIGWMMDRYPNLYFDMSYGWYDFHRQGFEAFAKWRTRSHKWLNKYAHRLMFATDMVLEKTKDAQYVDDTLRSYLQILETEKFRFFMRPQRPMHGMNLDPVALKKIYVDAPRTWLQTDDEGNLLDRSKVEEGKPAAGLPPTVPEVTPLKPGEGPPPDKTRKKKK
jgi:predicted TIM-barrel fold metal-dependent hydrolase